MFRVGGGGQREAAALVRLEVLTQQLRVQAPREHDLQNHTARAHCRRQEHSMTENHFLRFLHMHNQMESRMKNPLTSLITLVPGRKCFMVTHACKDGFTSLRSIVRRNTGPVETRRLQAHHRAETLLYRQRFGGAEGLQSTFSIVPVKSERVGLIHTQVLDLASRYIKQFLGHPNFDQSLKVRTQTFSDVIILLASL